jgi:CP family cyanate transporter-like MFS transporter
MTIRRDARLGFSLVGVLLIAANLRVSFTSVGPLLDDIRGDLGLGGAAAGLLTALPLLAFAAASPIAPWFAAKLGIERTLWTALAVLAAGIVLRSLPLLGAVWIGTALLGVAIGCMNVILPSLVKRDFPRHVGQVTGIYTATQGGMAAVGAGIVVPVAHGTGLGWPAALGIWAGLAVIAMAVFAPQLSKRPDPDARRSGRHLLEAGAAPVGNRNPWGSSLAWKITVFMGLQSLSFYVFVSWLPSIELSHGTPAATSGWHLFIFQLVGMGANLGTAALLHRMRDQRLIALVGALLDVVAFAGLWLAPRLSLLWVVLGAAACGILIVVALSLFSLRTQQHGQAAALSGMAQSIGYLIAGVGPILVGGLMDATGSWSLPLMIMTALMVVLCGFALAAGRDRYIG